MEKSLARVVPAKDAFDVRELCNCNCREELKELVAKAVARRDVEGTRTGSDTKLFECVSKTGNCCLWDCTAVNVEKEMTEENASEGKKNED
jgi:hypothetical protein